MEVPELLGGWHEKWLCSDGTPARVTIVIDPGMQNSDPLALQGSCAHGVITRPFYRSWAARGGCLLPSASHHQEHHVGAWWGWAFPLLYGGFGVWGFFEGSGLELSPQIDPT